MDFYDEQLPLRDPSNIYIAKFFRHSDNFLKIVLVLLSLPFDIFVDY